MDVKVATNTHWLSWQHQQIILILLGIIDMACNW
jgi:hypothetical protein